MNEEAGRWFVLWAEDPDYACPCLEERFIVHDAAMLRDVVDKECAFDSELQSVAFWLDEDQLTAIRQRFGTSDRFSGYDHVAVSAWPKLLRDVPYLVHTNFELFLMLEGRKQLAAFSEVAPSEWLDDYLSLFEPYVAEGHIIRRIVETPFASPFRGQDGQTYDCERRVLFALPGQEWRIDAYLLLWKVAEKTGWNETLETLEGSLYGYEDWQIDWWLAERRRRAKENEVSRETVVAD